MLQKKELEATVRLQKFFKNVLWRARFKEKVSLFNFLGQEEVRGSL